VPPAARRAEDAFALAGEAAGRLRGLTGVERYEVAVVLGSGWDAVADRLGRAEHEIPQASLPGFVPIGAPGHRGTLRSLVVADRPVLLQLGRPHGYEGHRPTDCVHPIRTAIAAGCRVVVLTNGVGTIRRDLDVGEPVLVRDHVNLTGRSPLTGLSAGLEGDGLEGNRLEGEGATTKGDRAGDPRPTIPIPATIPATIPSPYVDLSDAYSPRLRDLARRMEGGVSAEGVYAGFAGPQFETPAEVEMARRLGADLVGMSLVWETIAARHLGAEVLAISLVTNRAAGTAPGRIDPAEVSRAGNEAAGRLADLLQRLLDQV